MTKLRDGFVIAGGGGVLVLEEYEHAKARGAKYICRINWLWCYFRWIRYGSTIR